MIKIYTVNDKIKLKTRIENMNIKKFYIELFELIYKNKIEYSITSYGVVINIKIIEDNNILFTIEKLCIKYIRMKNKYNNNILLNEKLF